MSRGRILWAGELSYKGRLWGGEGEFESFQAHSVTFTVSLPFTFTWSREEYKTETGGAVPCCVCSIMSLPAVIKVWKWRQIQKMART